MWVGLSSGVGGVVIGVVARPGRSRPNPLGVSWSRLLDGGGRL